jgi:predicted aldo/keto reductase-like oxidoreductase
MAEPIRKTNFGGGGQQITTVGLGGEGILRTTNRLPHARKVLFEALDQGITYFDSAPAYSDSELYLGSIWKEKPAARLQVFQTSKSAIRDKAGAQAQLEKSLKRLHTDYLDLWQIHDLRTKRDFDAIAGPGGAIEAFVEAKKVGKVRNIGVTGHFDPNILARAVREWPLDSVMLPINPVEELIGGFLTKTLVEARRRNIAVIGMKILGASHYILPKYDISADILIRFALSYDTTVGIVGCMSPDEVQTLADAGRSSTRAISSNEKERIIKVFKPYYRKLVFYRGVI